MPTSTSSVMPSITSSSIPSSSPTPQFDQGTAGEQSATGPKIPSTGKNIMGSSVQIMLAMFETLLTFIRSITMGGGFLVV